MKYINICMCIIITACFWPDFFYERYLCISCARSLSVILDFIKLVEAICLRPMCWCGCVH